MKYFRLLPAVIVVGTCVLGLKGEGLVRSAWAEGQQASTSRSDPLVKDIAPLPNDPAIEEGKTDSSAEADVMSSLSKRRAALDARETDIDMRNQVLTAAEARIDAKIAALKQMQDQINALLGQRDTEQQKQVASLVKTYSAMKPKDAARIFNTLPDDVLVPVAQQMKSDVLAPILANMASDNAQKLTTKLASRLKLPETASQPAAPQAAAPQAAAPQAAAPAAPQAAAPTANAPKAGK